MKTPSLDHLFRLTTELCSGERSFSAGLDWIDRVLPHFTAACRDAVSEGTDAVFAAWQEWLTSKGVETVRDAGDMEIFVWRREWLTLLIQTAVDLRREDTYRNGAARRALAEKLYNRRRLPFGWLPLSFWLSLVDMLSGQAETVCDDAYSVPVSIAFPLVLTDRMVVAGESVEAILADLTLEPACYIRGEVFPDPSQIATTCFDSWFGAIFAQAADVVSRHIRPGVIESGQTTPSLPSIRVRLVARRPEHAVFLQKLVLRGPSAGGALAVGVYALAQQCPVDRSLAVSFALTARGETVPDDRCHAVGGAYEKARGCAREGMRVLAVSVEQASQAGFYGHLQNVAIVGAEKVADALRLLDSTLLAPAAPALPAISEDGGVLPIGSPLYMERRSDQAFHAALDLCAMIVLVKGPSKIGKTSLLVRGVDRARRGGARLVYVDLQSMGRDELRSQRDLYSALSRIFARELSLSVTMDDEYDHREGPNKNFENYLFKHALGLPVIWFMDEVDRLFDFDFYTDVFSLMRSWHNRRPVHAELANLTLVLSYSTETHLLIEDAYQSPFNVGLKVELEDFTIDQVSELNKRLGSPLRSTDELQQFYALVGGHPHLVCRGLSWMSQERRDISAFMEQAGRENGVFGSHLRRLRQLTNKPELLSVIVDLLNGRPCRDNDAFLHLRNAGVVVGDDCRSAKMRCKLYGDFLRERAQPPAPASRGLKVASQWLKSWRTKT